MALLMEFAMQAWDPELEPVVVEWDVLYSLGHLNIWSPADGAAWGGG